MLACTTCLTSKYCALLLPGAGNGNSTCTERESSVNNIDRPGCCLLQGIFVSVVGHAEFVERAQLDVGHFQALQTVV